MASTNWEKYKGGGEAKAHFRHNSQDKRLQTRKHKNPDIDRSRTHLNFSILGLSYDERCEKYDKAIDDYKSKFCKDKAMRKDAVTCLGLESSVPKEIAGDDVKCAAWCRDLYQVYCDAFGAENIIDMDVHFDEIHDYYDPETKKMETSRAHAHANIMPFTVDGRLCCKEIFTRGNMMKLNNAIEAMTMQKYGCHYMTGEPARKKSVEQLKQESYEALTEEIEQKQQQSEALDNKLFEDGSTLNAVNMAVDKATQRLCEVRNKLGGYESIEQREKRLTERERALTEQEQALEQRERKVSNRERAAEQRSSELDEREQKQAQTQASLNEQRQQLQSLAQEVERLADEARAEEEMREKKRQAVNRVEKAQELPPVQEQKEEPEPPKPKRRKFFDLF